MADELSDESQARKDLLLGMYADVRAHARHAETLRSNVVNFMIVVAPILIAVIASDGDVTGKDLLLCLVIIVVGMLGLAFAASYTELFERDRKRAMRIREALDGEFFNSGNTIASLFDEADELHEASQLYYWSRRLTGSTHRFWLVLPTLVVTSGLLLAIVAI